jgi:hypothetical protein
MSVVGRRLIHGPGCVVPITCIEVALGRQCQILVVLQPLYGVSAGARKSLNS